MGKVPLSTILAPVAFNPFERSIRPVPWCPVSVNPYRGEQVKSYVLWVRG